MHRTALAWFRRDLRLADNPALLDAAACAERIAPVFISAEGRDPHTGGTALLDRTARSLAALEVSLAIRGLDLARLSGESAVALVRAAAECDATAVTCTRDWTPAGLAEERAVQAALAAVGVELRVAESQLLAAPGSLATAGGTPFRVFTPFYGQWLRAVSFSAPEPPPGRLVSAQLRVAGTARGFKEHAEAPHAPETAGVGETAAQQRLEEFAATGVADYAETHDLPAIRGTSELSAALAVGELSPRQVAWAVIEAVGSDVAAPFLRQLAWREFAYHVLAANPGTLDHPLRPEFSAMPWSDDPDALAAWTAGQTGWPLVDAGMRQLAQTGWMHNRVRMVVASVLTKDLLVPWQRGAAAFERMLGDYDPAANAFNWQWVAGSGADAAPYFRIFNPTLQGTRFDPDGAYVRRWVPELTRVPARYVHRPWEAPEHVLDAAGVRLGDTYPHPLIDHGEARLRALAALSVVQANRR